MSAAREAARRLAEACRALGLAPQVLADHLDRDDLLDLAAHENAHLPAFWQASAWATAEAGRTGRCTCRRCAATRRASDTAEPLPRPLVACGDCRHYLPDTVNPPAGMGGCALGPGRAHWPMKRHRCADWRQA